MTTDNHAAPFAVVRWSNMWFPAHLGFFGDWFGGPLQRLFGRGIKDHHLKENDWKRFLPAWAHTLYFSYPDVEEPGTATGVLHELMELEPKKWLMQRLLEISLRKEDFRYEAESDGDNHFTIILYKDPDGRHFRWIETSGETSVFAGAVGFDRWLDHDEVSTWKTA